MSDEKKPYNRKDTQQNATQSEASVYAQRSVASSVVELKREIGLLSAVSLIVSVMIGSGIFISPSSVLEKSGSVGLCLVMWALCGAISYLGALSFAELGTVVPSSGAEYAFFRAAFNDFHNFFGPLPGFIYIWVIVFLVRPAEVAILVLTFSEYTYTPIVHYFKLEISPFMESVLKKLIALLAVGLITYINFVSVKIYVKMQNMFSSLKILACLAVIGGGIYHLAKGNTEYINKGFEGTKTNIKDLVLAFYTGLWSFDGWTSVTVVSEEIKSPNRNIPLSISLGVPLVTVLYFTMNVAYMSVLSIEEMIAAPAVAMVFAERLFGHFAPIIPVAVVLSTFSCAMSVQFGVSRLCFAAGRVGHMVECFSYIHVRRMTPAPAVILQGTLTSVFIITGSIIRLIEFVSFIIWIFYGLAMVALIVMRSTKKEASRPFKVPIIIPYFLVALSVFIAIVPLVLQPDPLFLAAIVFIAIGVLAYYLLIYRKKHFKFTRFFCYYVQILMEVIPSER